MFDPKSAPFRPISLIFGVGFLGVSSVLVTLMGLNVLWFNYITYSQWDSSRAWIVTPAQLTAAELAVEKEHGTKTYRPTARYRYEFNGITYTSNQIDFSNGSGPAGSLAEQQGLDLVRLLQNGGKTTCLVNPNDPSSAVLDNRPPISDLAAGLSLALPMLFAGPILFVAACYGGVLVNRAFEARSKHPDRPWLWRADWAIGRVQARTTFSAFVIGFAWLVFAPIFCPVAVSGAVRTARFDFLGIAMLATVSLISLLLIVWGLYLWRRKQRWGRSVAELATIPCPRGGLVAGSIFIPKRMEHSQRYRVELICMRVDSYFERNNPKGWFHEYWADGYEIQCPLSVRNEGTTIPFLFSPPSSLPTPLDKENIVWLLTVEAETPGVDLLVQFELPIFDCSNPSTGPGKRLTCDEFETHVAPETLESLAAGIHAKVQYPDDDQIVLTFSRGMKTGDSISAVVLSIASVLIGIGCYVFQAPVLAYLFPVALLALGSWGISYHALSHGELRLSSTEIFAERRGLILRKSLRIATQDVTKVSVKADVIGGRRPPYKNIMLTTVKKIDHALLTEISSLTLARKLAERIAAKILPGKPIQIVDK